MNETFLETIKSAHFVGIGGIGVSAIARLMLSRGVAVSGSDRAPSLVTEKLEALGAKVYFGHSADNVPQVLDALVYSPAIPVDNAELQIARERSIPCYSYPEALGLISRGMRTIAVSGTHGKTTTTAMLADVFVAAQKTPTVIVGSLLKNSGSNFIAGTSDIFIVEACEYKRSFLNLSPEVLVITNIDNDHLDYYGTVEGVQQAFVELAKKVPTSGAIVCNPNDPLVAPVLVGVSARIIDYTKEIISQSLIVPGDHNINNAKAVLSAARFFEIREEDAVRALVGFQGTWRRQEFKGETKEGVPVYDDYAHHPTEIRATLQGFRARNPSARIRVVFQPHLYSRTKLLLNDFAQSFSSADEVMVVPIYAARETVDPEISSEILAQAIANTSRPDVLRVWSLDGLDTAEQYLRDTLKKGDVVLTMGAGDVWRVGEVLVK